MKESYWDQLARDFDEEVFNPVHADTRKRIISSIKAESSNKSHIIDLGCGTGRLSSLLSKNFGHVTAVDISEKCLAIARKRFISHKNVDFIQRDLSQAWPDNQKFDLGICLNVAMMPDYSTRMAVLANICSLIKPGGKLLLLVPALESVLLTNHRLLEWNIRESKTYKEAMKATAAERGLTMRSIEDGIVAKGNTPTKHYFKEELETLIPLFGHSLISIEKVEYQWDTEFEQPPDWMQTPYPWDWLLSSHSGP